MTRKELEALFKKNTQRYKASLGVAAAGLVGGATAGVHFHNTPLAAVGVCTLIAGRLAFSNFWMNTLTYERRVDALDESGRNAEPEAVRPQFEIEPGIRFPRGISGS